MEGIISFLKNFDIDNLLPELGKFLASIKFWMVALSMVGPLLMLILGLMYYYKPPKEANYEWGFRTYYTMGSVEVWQFTQALAGKCWIILGAIMGAASLVVGVILCFFNAEVVVVYALIVVAIELFVVVSSWIWINTYVLKFYDKNGDLRPGAKPPVIKKPK